MNTIRILIYTDYEFINEDPTLYSWGLTELEKFAVHKTRPLANLEFDLKHRFESTDDPLLLTDAFLEPYHELWVLGFIGARQAPFELNHDEVEALRKWMDDGGGLMMAGDHAAGLCGTDDAETFDVHGRSLGEPMKRAGQLRVWQGPPTGCVDKLLKDRDNFNTCEGNEPEKLDLLNFQSDEAALNLQLPETPHRLFWFEPDSDGDFTFIKKFPDHQHESKLVIPAYLNEDWPANSPNPEVVAVARDRRFPNEQRNYPIVIAYDGHRADVGRIVVDSSFHHYLNVNLFGLQSRDATGYPAPDSDLDQIAQFYGNLALWLTPKKHLLDLKLGIFFRLATDPDVFESRGSGIMNLGRVGGYALKLRIGEANLWRLVALEPDDSNDDLEKLIAVTLLGQSISGTLTESKLGLAVILTESEKIEVLGAIIEAHHRYFAAHGAVTPGWLKEQPQALDMIRNGIELIQDFDPKLADKLRPFLEFNDKQKRYR